MPEPQLIVRCFPLDMSWLPADVADQVRSAITVLHTEAICTECYQPAWIGPGQLAAMNNDPTARVVCWQCIVRIPVFRQDIPDFSKMRVVRPETAEAPSRFPSGGPR